MLTKTERRQKLAHWYKTVCVRKATNHEHTGFRGGYLVPPQLKVGVDEYIAEESFFHNHATVLPMTGLELNVPTADPGSAASGSSPLFGGFQLFWTEEDAAPTASNPAFENMKLVAYNLAGYGLVSNQLIQDGGETLGAYLEFVIGKAAAFYITQACFNGNGIAKPLGLVSDPGTAVVNRTTGGTVVAADFANMLTKLLPACLPHAWWCVSSAAYGILSGLAGFFPVLTDDSAMVGWYRGGYVFCTEALPKLGTKGDVVLFDPRLFILGEHPDIEIAWTDQFPTAFGANQSVVRVWWRGNGQLAWAQTGTAANTESGVSPAVVLN